MANIVTCKTTDGKTIQYVDEVIGSGSMKDVYFSPDKSYVVAFYHKPQNDQARERINMITGRYRQNIFEQSGGCLLNTTPSPRDASTTGMPGSA